MTAPEKLDGLAKTTLKKNNIDTSELSNPILSRDLQNTITNFPAFKPPPAEGRL
ncbi:Mediator of RNA polymerase II transcription subunit 6 [Puccinia graminis f. sp. tritici]|uniref:Mediator of RNA polymerase II transcription subunit 6 n=1 Tax=Puccinia graminis f. sp. tritici TaxID=56615 RepID=A0A5B0LUS7_PUCGR|nr:Mediator of RNA polymerase II transcription subunit 6 [Puccinia graminis f. sp. tritici]